MKLILFLFICLFQTFTFSHGANFTQCQPEDGDYELDNQVVNIDGVENMVFTTFAVYPHDRELTAVVHCIVAIDKAVDEQNEGIVVLKQGGIGKKYVDLMLQSQRGGGLYFDVSFYGQ